MTICATCGNQNAPGAKFCGSCGAPLPGSGAAVAPVPDQAPAPATPLGAGRPSTSMLLQLAASRAPSRIIPLIGVALVANIDYQLHGQAIVALLVAAGGAAITLFFREALGWVTRKVGPRRLPPWLASAFITVPLAGYFLLRGKGMLSDADGLVVGALIVGLPILFNRVAPQLDEPMRGFYATRNRILPAAVRPLVLAGLSLFITFGLIHGNLSDVKILWGATASKANTPTAGAAVMTVLTTMVLAFLLLREPREGRTQQAGP